jgi:thioester reductase-like protein
MSNRETLFVTGFPGFIANRLLERLAGNTAANDCRFILLVQPSLAARARNDVARLAQLTGKPLDDFQLIEGDISQPGLGLTAESAALAREQTTRAFHLAAVYDLAVERELAMRVNVGGTATSSTSRARCLTFVTFIMFRRATSQGKREGVILETELRHDAGYRNFYEESKYPGGDGGSIGEARVADHDSSSGGGVR